MKAKTGYLIHGSAYDYMILVGEDNKNYMIAEGLEDVTLKDCCEYFEETDFNVYEINEEEKLKWLQIDKVIETINEEDIYFRMYEDRRY